MAIFRIYCNVEITIRTPLLPPAILSFGDHRGRATGYTFVLVRGFSCRSHKHHTVHMANDRFDKAFTKAKLLLSPATDDEGLLQKRDRERERQSKSKIHTSFSTCRCFCWESMMQICWCLEFSSHFSGICYISRGQRSLRARFRYAATFRSKQI